MKRQFRAYAPSVQQVVGAGLARLYDPQPEGLATRGLKAVKAGRNARGMFALLALTNALGLLIVSCSYYISVLGGRDKSGPYGLGVVELFFYSGLLLIFVPNLVRLLSPAPSRVERIYLLCSLGICIYLVRFMTSPLHFSEYDEFLNWRTADDILRTGHLFSQNPMLPVNPYYAGLHIVTNAVSAISGLDTFHAGIIVVSVARLLMILSLFLLYEQLTQSSRMAGIATIIYMTNPHFVFFDAIFSYESMALPLATFMFYILVRYHNGDKHYHWAGSVFRLPARLRLRLRMQLANETASLPAVRQAARKYLRSDSRNSMIFVACFVLLAVTITHHMTDYVFDGLLILWAAISLFQGAINRVPTGDAIRIPGVDAIRRNLVMMALLGVFLSLAYAFLVKGNPVWQYLSAYFGSALAELSHIIAGDSSARSLFMSTPGGQTPIWDRLLMTASVGMVALGMPFGLLSLWRQYRHDALSAMLGIVSCAYPVTQVFRFTEFGSDITDRSAAFLFLAIAYVLTILITHFWPTRKLSWKATSLVTCALSIIFLGGVLIDSGPGWRVLPGPYEVVADERSINSESIQAALWSLSYLGPGKRMATDRIDQMLLSTFGDQNMVTSQTDHVDISPLFFTAHFDAEDAAILQSGAIQYLVVDLRLSTSLPVQGFYYENFEAGAYHRTSPISRAALTKFDSVAQINRCFDSGNTVIYDVGQ